MGFTSKEVCLGLRPQSLLSSMGLTPKKVFTLLWPSGHCLAPLVMDVSCPSGNSKIDQPHTWVSHVQPEPSKYFWSHSLAERYDPPQSSQTTQPIATWACSDIALAVISLFSQPFASCCFSWSFLPAERWRLHGRDKWEKAKRIRCSTPELSVPRWRHLRQWKNKAGPVVLGGQHDTETAKSTPANWFEEAPFKAVLSDI